MKTLFLALGILGLHYAVLPKEPKPPNAPYLKALMDLKADCEHQSLYTCQDVDRVLAKALTSRNGRP